MSTCLVSRVPSYWIVKGCAFAVGFSFFGDPVFQRTLDFLNHKVPNWKKALDLHRYDSRYADEISPVLY